MNTDVFTPDVNLDKNLLQELALQPGPCLTLLLPAFAQGASQAPHVSIAKTLLKSVETQSGDEKLTQVVESLHAAIDQASKSKTRIGGPAIAIFCAPGFQKSFRIHDVPEQAMAGPHFYLTPFIADGGIAQDYFALALSTKRLRLFHCSGSRCEQQSFPAGVPDNLEEAGQFERSESGLSNRKAVGAMKGGIGGVHFGVISESKTSDAYLHDFFETVDRGLQDTFQGRPLVLFGVEEEIAAYRRASVNPKTLLSGHAGNADYLRTDEIATMGRRALLDDYHHKGLAVLGEYREMPDRHRTSHAIEEVLRVAKEGRVHQLCVRESTKLPDPATNEDLINAAAVETLRASGQVYAIPSANMQENDPVAAILRY